MVPVGAHRRNLWRDLVVCGHLQCPGGAQLVCRYRLCPYPPCRLRQPELAARQNRSVRELNKPQELGSAETEAQGTEAPRAADAPPEEMTSLGEPTARRSRVKYPRNFILGFGDWSRFRRFCLPSTLAHGRRAVRDLKGTVDRVVPLGVLTIVVLVVILLGICTATESAAIGALGAIYLAVMVKFLRAVVWWSFLGAMIGVGLGLHEGEDIAYVDRCLDFDWCATFLGTLVPGLWNLRSSPELRQNFKEATFLTAKTTAMVCWLFIGSALFSGVFALHGGQGLIERWVLGMNLSPLGFLLFPR